MNLDKEFETIRKNREAGKVPAGMRRLTNRFHSVSKTPYVCKLHGDPDRNLELEPMSEREWMDLKSDIHTWKMLGLNEQERYERMIEKYGLII
jgi:hypothetical protein